MRKVVREEQNAADKALEQIEDVKVLVKQSDDKPVQLAEPDPMPELRTEPARSFPEKQTEFPLEKSPHYLPEKRKIIANPKRRQFVGIFLGLFLITYCIVAGAN